MFDDQVVEILEFFLDPGGEIATGDREKTFSNFTLGFLPADVSRIVYLLNYGFGLAASIPAIVPYNLSHRANGYVRGLPLGPAATHFGHDGKYPILAGSAVFLGADHALCEDLDFVLYLEVGDLPEVRHTVAKKFVEQVMLARPQQVVIAVNGKDRGEWPATGEEIPEKIERYIPLIDVAETSTKIGNIRHVHLEWPAHEVALGKPASLRIHFVHSNTVSRDIHPYQEMHGCNAPDFFHRNKHWLSGSFGAYFEWLRNKISEQSVENSPIKAAKRAIPLSGMVGDVDTQSRLVGLLDAYGHQSAESTMRTKTLEAIKKIVHDIRIEVEIKMTEVNA